MTSKKKTSPEHGDAMAGREAGQKASPAWSDGLKQLYDDIVDEPLPDAFMDLLSKLDDGDDPKGNSDGCGAA